MPVAALLALLAGCGTEPPPDWQWWTSADSAAVLTEVGHWQGSLDARQALSDTLRLNLSMGISFADSSSPTGETLYKFKRLLSVWADQEERGHSDGLLFGVAADTEAMNDSFCQVQYCDTIDSTLLHFRYDSLWVIGYRPDTLIDTSPPVETTIVFRASSTEERGFATPQELTKTYDWSGWRVLHLPKTDSLTEYRLQKFTGASVIAPNAEDAPSIRRVTLTQPGRIDTFFYTPRESPDLRGLYNLRTLGELYTVQQGADLGVGVSVAGDSAVERERCFVGVAGRKYDITSGAKAGSGTVSFPDTGLVHLYVQAVSLSGIGYTRSQYKTVYWAIPIRVTPRP
jgi:hypothetical protein